MQRDPDMAGAEIELRFVLGRARSDERIMRGGVVELDRLSGDPVEVYADGALVARGEAVWINGRWGVRVRQVLAPNPGAGADAAGSPR